MDVVSICVREAIGIQHERMIDDFFCVADDDCIESATLQAGQLRRTITLFGLIYKLSKSIAPKRVARG